MRSPNEERATAQPAAGQKRSAHFFLPVLQGEAKDRTVITTISALHPLLLEGEGQGEGQRQLL